MGSLADFLKQRERDAIGRDDSQAGTTTSQSRPGTPVGAMGCKNGRAAPESRDSQACEGVRAMLTAIASNEGIPQTVVDAIDLRDLGACAGLPAPTLNAYLRALHRARQMTAGGVPAGWTHVARCAGCGPVWLPASMPAAVRACPWCQHRRNGRHPPTPHP